MERDRKKLGLDEERRERDRKNSLSTPAGASATEKPARSMRGEWSAMKNTSLSMKKVSPPHA